MLFYCFLPTQKPMIIANSQLVMSFPQEIIAVIKSGIATNMPENPSNCYCATPFGVYHTHLKTIFCKYRKMKTRHEMCTIEFNLLKFVIVASNLIHWATQRNDDINSYEW